MIKFRSKRVLGANQEKIGEKNVSDRENSMYGCSEVRDKGRKVGKKG